MLFADHFAQQPPQQADGGAVFAGGFLLDAHGATLATAPGTLEQPHMPASAVAVVTPAVPCLLPGNRGIFRARFPAFAYPPKAGVGFAALLSADSGMKRKALYSRAARRRRDCPRGARPETDDALLWQPEEEGPRLGTLAVAESKASPPAMTAPFPPPWRCW